MPAKMMLVFEPEEIFCSSDVRFHGQPIGIILAETHEIANYAAEQVDVTYEGTNDKKVLPTLQDMLREEPTRVRSFPPLGEVAKEFGKGATHKIKGHFEIGRQFHYTMEPHTCVCIPTEDGMDVYSSTQWMDITQVAISDALNVPNSNLNLIVRRLGGGFGVKGSRSIQVACAAAVAAHLLNRPVRFVMTIEANMNIIGKRYACINDYETEVDDNGRIHKMVNDYIEDYGCSPNEPVFFHTTQFFNNCYDYKHFTVNAKVAITDAASNTFCRAPGTTEGVAMIENIMEHIARKVNKDPLEVRLSNIPADSDMKKLLPEFAESVGE